MGDGGVACMPLQHNSIMERFPIQDNTTTLCSGGKTGNTTATTTATTNNSSNNNSNGNGTTSNFNSKPKKVLKKVIKVKKIVTVKKTVAEKSELGSEKAAKVSKEKEAKSSKEKEAKITKETVAKSSKEKEAKISKEADNGSSSVDNKVQNTKEEVEEGELGTLKWPPKAEVENGEFVPSEKARRNEIEKGEIVVEKWRKVDVEKGEVVSGTGRWRKGEFGREDIEKGEFIPDRWPNKDDYSYNKSSRGRYDNSKERTPPSGKYSSEDIYRRKELSRSGSNQHSKNTFRWEGGLERNIRISSKIVDEEGSYKGEYSNGKNHGKEYTSGNRLKRYGTESESNERKHYGDYGDYACSKSRRLSEDCARTAHSDHYSRHSLERFYRNSSSSSSSRISSLEKYPSRHHEPTLSSKVVYDRHGRSPVFSERSPRDRVRYYDYRDRSPVRRERSPYRRERSPYGRERSPYGREKSPYGRERSPYGRDKSPYERSRHHDYRRSPTHSERSSQDQYHDRRDRTPNFVERSPHDRARPSNHREAIRKGGGASEKRNSQFVNKGHEDKLGQRDSVARDSKLAAKESQDKNEVHDNNVLEEKKENSESHKEEQSQSPTMNKEESPRVDGPPPEELLSMEEDMDICDTPPHVPVMTDSSTGKWFYLDYFGMECGPSKLCDLKTLVDEGVLVSDHLIKHVDSDRWVTIENAVSPLVTANFPSITSDTITQLVSPPEAPGNLLADTGGIGKSGIQSGEEVPVTLRQSLVSISDSSCLSESLEDLNIDERVGALLGGFTVVPGRELETIGGILISYVSLYSPILLNNVPVLLLI